VQDLANIFFNESGNLGGSGGQNDITMALQESRPEPKCPIAETRHREP